MKSIFRMKTSLVLGVLLLGASIAPGQTPPKREFRGAWIASVVNLDWPVSNASAPDVQRSQLTTMLDVLKATGITAVVFQVRPECDALYASSIEPWSYWLTGHEGSPPVPLWDPLQFAIDEAHKRGMELHAWFNPYRAIRDTTAYTRAPNHVSVLHPDWIIRFNGIKLRILNPGIPEVRAYNTTVIMDVVRRYDVDGVHFDDYFYPYPEGSFSKITTQDTATFAKYPRGFTNIDDWRRDNVNLQMKMVHDSIQGAKPWVKLGISPFGIWKNGVPPGIIGLDAYSVIYGDAIAWLHQHTVDYLTPQLYWKIGGSQDYSKLMPWWADSTSAYSTHLYTGHIFGSYTTSELPNQVRLNRANPKTQGSVFFRATFFESNTLNFTDSCEQNLYRYQALLPTMAWKDTVAPYMPRGIRYEKVASTGLPAVQWDLPMTAPDGDSASRYVVYRFNHTPSLPSDIEDARAILDVVGSRSYAPPSPSDAGPYYYLATALDRNYNESLVSSLLTISAPAAPILASPANGSSAEPESVAVSWHGVPVAAAYRLQMALDPSFSILVLDDSLITDTLHVARGFPGQATVYWRVSARNAGGTGAFSGTFSFSTGFPLATTLVFPANISPDIPVDVQFLWNRSSAATSYRLQISRAADFATLVADTGGIADTTFLFTGLQNYTVYYWHVKASNAIGSADWSAAFRFRTVASSAVAEAGHLPTDYSLDQNFPNPFNPATTITYALPRAGHVRLEVYDLLGRLVTRLVDEMQEPGYHQVVWNAASEASGIYFYRITASGFTTTKRMILVR